MNSILKNSLCQNILRGRRFYHDIMKNVPQPVVVITTTSKEQLNRGVTCASFNNVSFDPPIISFSLKSPSRIHSIIEETRIFTVNILANHQVNIATHFALPANKENDQFKEYKYFVNSNGVPEFADSCSSVTCKLHSSLEVGDHNVCYGDIINTAVNPSYFEPLLYYSRTYRSIGEEIFIAAFEDLSLPIDQWSHVAHVRMAWNYLKDYGKQHATPIIIEGIKSYNARNASRIKRGYNDTITNFYINIIHNAIVEHGAKNNFNEFALSNANLMKKDLLLEYYTNETLNSETAKLRFLPPDIKQI